LHTTSRVTLSGDRVHVGVTSHFTGVKGTTTSGARYTMMDVENQQTNFSTDFAPSEFTAERTMNLTRLGEDGTFVDGDDLRVHVISYDRERERIRHGRQARRPIRLPLTAYRDRAGDYLWR